MSNNKSLIISICIFIIVGMSALLLILNKGHIGEIGLVSLKDNSEIKNQNMPKLELMLEKKYLSSKAQEEAILSATVDGEKIKEGIEYKSSDENIAKIVDGKVVAIKNGKVFITAIYDGQTDTKDIQVITPIKNINFTSTSKSIRVGKELQMKLQVTPSDANINTLKYTSSNEEIATVNANGIVTGISTGKVTITVEDEYTGEEKSIDLTIRK